MANSLAGESDDRLVQLRAFAAGYGLGIGGAILALVLSLVGLGAAALSGIELPTIGRLGLLFVLGQYIPFMGMPLAYLSLRGMDAGEIREYLGVSLPSLKGFALIPAGVIAIFLLAVASNVIVTALGVTPAKNSTAQAAQQSPGIIPLLIVAMFLVVGPCEETLFRGTVQSRLRESFSAPVAITLTAVLFAAVHITALLGGSGSVVASIGVLLAPSFVFGTIYEYTENLVVPALTHSIWNTLLLTAIWFSQQADIPTDAGGVLLAALPV